MWRLIRTISTLPVSSTAIGPIMTFTPRRIGLSLTKYPADSVFTPPRTSNGSFVPGMDGIAMRPPNLSSTVRRAPRIAAWTRRDRKCRKNTTSSRALSDDFASTAWCPSCRRTRSCRSGRAHHRAFKFRAWRRNPRRFGLEGEGFALAQPEPSEEAGTEGSLSHICGTPPLVCRHARRGAGYGAAGLSGVNSTTGGTGLSHACVLFCGLAGICSRCMWLSSAPVSFDYYFLRPSVAANHGIEAWLAMISFMLSLARWWAA